MGMQFGGNYSMKITYRQLQIYWKLTVSFSKLHLKGEKEKNETKQMLVTLSKIHN